MLYSGEFISHTGNRVKVEIVTHGVSTPKRIIGDAGLYFDTNPVEIRTETTDTLDPVVRRSATIRLQTDAFIPDFYSANCSDCAVKVTRGSEVMFMGYVEPMALSQGFTSPVEAVELECIDCLSAMQYYRYGDIGKTGVDHESVKATAGEPSFREILMSSLASSSVPFGMLPVYFDGSRSLPGYSGDIFSGLSIPEVLFLGEEEDDAWTRLEVVEELLRYLGLRILQTAGAFYVFSWDKVKQGKQITWSRLGGGSGRTTAGGTTAITIDNAYGTDTQLGISECFSQVSLTCETTPTETLVSSPLDKDGLTSPYTGRQKYFTEIITGEPGKSVLKQYYFAWMCRGHLPKEFPYLYHAKMNLIKDGIPAANVDSYFDKECRKKAETSKVVEWYMQSMRSKGWNFPYDYYPDMEANATQNFNQHGFLYPFAASQCRATLLKLGSITHEFKDISDNSPKTRCDMSPYLVLSVNGNGKDSETEASPSPSTLLAKFPVAEYNGSVSGGVFSPADDDTVNYLVFSGKLTLAPIMQVSASAGAVSEDKGGYKEVDSEEEGKKRWLSCIGWSALHPRDEPQEGSAETLWPVSEHMPKQYKYDAAETIDTVAKVPVLACMLVIGNKVLVETGTSGTPADYEWRTFKERSACADDDEYFAQTFTLGFNPGVGDYIIGEQRDILNNISADLGLDEEGTAIPIRKSDKVSGRVRFYILGPVFSMWDHNVYVNKTWFRPRRWDTSTVPLLSHVSAIFVKDFEAKLASDNAHNENTEDNDLIYISDTEDGFINRKDDLSLRIHSDLTASERSELGIRAAVNVSTVKNAATESGVLTITDTVTGTTDKPERLYVAGAWEEWHTPRVLLSQSLQDTPGKQHEWQVYTHPALPERTFAPQGVSHNLIEDSVKLDLKEI